MRSIFRYAILVILMSFAVLNLQPANAQATCTLKGLTATDCQLIADAGTNLATMQTFNMDYNVSFKASGLQNGNITFSSHGTGPVDVSGMNDTDISTFIGQLVFATKTTSTLTTGATTLNGALEVRMVNNFVYMNSDLFTQSKWDKFDFGKVFSAALLQSQNQGQALQTYDLSTLSLDELKGIQNNGFADIPNAYQAKSQPGKTIDGQATTQIVIDYNLYNYLTYLFAPENRDAAKALMGVSGQNITDAQFNQITALLPLFKTTLQATKLEQTWAMAQKTNCIMVGV